MSRIASASLPVSRATGEKPMWPPSSPPYQPVIWLMSRFGTPACTRSNGCSRVAISSGACFSPQTSAPGIRSNAAFTFAKRWSTTASSPYSAKRMIQRPISSSRAIRSITSSGIGSSPWYHGARLEITDAIEIVFQICGTFSIVRSSISPRSVSTTGPRSSSRQTRSQSGM